MGEHSVFSRCIMAKVTLEIIDGADRGKILTDLETPVTIGREEGNTVQLNDDRVSRFHLKIQQDHDRIVLTDLESTNGTKVNGETTHLRILRYGDMISIGRSVLRYGSREQIAQRLAGPRRAASAADDDELTRGDEGNEPPPASLEFELSWHDRPGDHATLGTLYPPELPKQLSPGQAAELSELLEYFHIRVRSLLDSVEMEDEADRVSLDFRQWQNLLDIQARLAEYLRRISEPE